MNKKKYAKPIGDSRTSLYVYSPTTTLPTHTSPMPNNATANNTRRSPAQLKLQTRLMLNDEIAFGPGKADLLDAIAASGSISAAGKQMGMSYRRAWLLVDTMNRCFAQPLVETITGGSHGGGARLTDEGVKILHSYRQLQHDLAQLAAQQSALLTSRLREQPLPASGR